MRPVWGTLEKDWTWIKVLAIRWADAKDKGTLFWITDQGNNNSNSGRKNVTVAEERDGGGKRKMAKDGEPGNYEWNFCRNQMNTQS